MIDDVISKDGFLEEAKRRFFNVMKDRPMRDDGSCWLWPLKTTAGYGQIVIWSKPILAHRVSFMLFREPIPKGHILHNICGIRNCVNPNHWELKRKNSFPTPLWKDKKRLGRKPGPYLKVALEKLEERENALRRILREDL
jgi:hypothetical protein